MANWLNRTFNASGADDPFLVAMLKDVTRAPRNINAYLQGKAAYLGSKLAGSTDEEARLDEANWIRGGYTMDEEEQQALLANPGKQLGKAGIDIATLYLTGLLGPSIKALPAIPKTLTRAGLGAAGGYAQSQPYLGENELLSSIFGGVGGVAGGAFGDVLSKGSKAGAGLQQWGKTAKIANQGYGISPTGGGITKASNLYDDVSKITGELGEKADAQGINNAYDKLLGTLKMVLQSSDEAGKSVNVDDIINQATDEAKLYSNVSDGSKAGMKKLASAMKIELNKVLKSSTDKVAQEGVENVTNVSLSDLASMKRALQDVAWKYTENAGNVGAQQQLQTFLHNAIDTSLKDNLGDVGSGLYSKMSTLNKASEGVLKKFGSDISSRQFIGGIGGATNIPLAGGLLSKGASAIGDVAEKAGGFASTVSGKLGDSLLGKVNSALPAEAASLMGGKLGGEISASMQKGGQTTPEAPQSGGYAPEQEGVTSDTAAIQGPMMFDATTDPLGLDTMYSGAGMGLSGGSSSQYDMQRLGQDLMRAVAGGNISAAEATYLYSMMEKMNGGTSITDQITSALNSSDTEGAKQLITQGLLSGEIDSSTAKAIYDMYGMGEQGTVSGLSLVAQKYYNVAATAQDAASLLVDMSSQQGQELPGLGKGISSTIGDWTNTSDPLMLSYRNKISSINLAVSNLIAGTNISKSEAARLKKLVPTMNDSVAEAQSKLQELLDMGLRNSGVTMDELESSLMNYNSQSTDMNTGYGATDDLGNLGYGE